MCAEESKKSTIEDLVELEIQRKGGSIRNRAALGALLKIIPVGGDALHYSLTAGSSAEDAERNRIKLELLCQLAEKIDGAISTMIDDGNKRGIDFVEISGSISAQGTNAKNIVGLDIVGRAAIIKPGTIVSVEGNNVQNITGVKIS